MSDPVLLDDGVGADVAKRIAAPMWGGLVSLTLLTLLVIPAMYVVWRSFALRRDGRAGKPVEQSAVAASSIAAYVHGCKLDRGMASTVAPPSSPGRAPRTTHAPRHSTSVHASSVKGSHASASAPHRLAAKIALTPVTAPALIKAVRSLSISYAHRAARRFFVESRRILHTSRQHVLDP
jgi:hypothetical protein